MKNAILKTTLMMFVAAFVVALTAPVVAHAQTSSAPQATVQKSKKKKKKTAKKVAQAQAPQRNQKIESESARLASSPAGVSGLKKPVSGKAKLSNDMVFDGSVVHGQYQIADGTTSVVENEKSLTSLIAPRRDFKDRMQAERSGQ